MPQGNAASSFQERRGFVRRCQKLFLRTRRGRRGGLASVPPDSCHRDVSVSPPIPLEMAEKSTPSTDPASNGSS